MDAPERSELPAVLVALLRGIVYRDESPNQWRDLVGLQSAARDYLGLLGLELIVDDSEGYAFLRQRQWDSEHASNTVAGDSGSAGADSPESMGTGDTTSPVPALIPRRPLSYPVSVLLVQLRKRLAQHDAQGGDTRLVLSREQMVDMMRTFLPGSTNEAKLADQIERHIARVEELGFLRALKDDREAFEVRRILRAFVNADWLADLESTYRTHAERLE